jgi:DNA-directed RNA polymerase specialized sigma24 family protein
MKSGPKPKPIDNSNIDPLGVYLLYEEYRGTAINAAVRYAKSRPGSDLPWVVQHCLIALYMAARAHKRQYDNTFAKYSKTAVIRALACYDHRDAGQRLELPADAVIGRGEDSEEFKLGELAERKLVNATSQSMIPRDREMARMYELREAVETCPELTRVERRVLLLRFFEDVDFNEIPKRVKGSKNEICRASCSAIRKLREHFKKKGHTVSDRPFRGIFSHGGGISVGSSARAR